MDTNSETQTRLMIVRWIYRKLIRLPKTSRDFLRSILECPNSPLWTMPVKMYCAKIAVISSIVILRLHRPPQGVRRFMNMHRWVLQTCSAVSENRKENTNSRTRRTKRRAEKRSRWQMQVFLVKVTRCRVFSEIGNYLFVRATSMSQMFMDLCHFVVLTGGANFPSLLFHSSMLPLQCHQG